MRNDLYWIGNGNIKSGSLEKSQHYYTQQLAETANIYIKNMRPSNTREQSAMKSAASHIYNNLIQNNYTPILYKNRICSDEQAIKTIAHDLKNVVHKLQEVNAATTLVSLKQANNRLRDPKKRFTKQNEQPSQGPSL